MGKVSFSSFIFPPFYITIINTDISFQLIPVHKFFIQIIILEMWNDDEDLQLQIEEEIDPEIQRKQIQRSHSQLQSLASSISPHAKSFTQNYLNALRDLNLQKISNCQLFLEFTFERKQTKSPLCGKILYKGNKAFRCKQCMLQENSIICIECFNSSNHQGHHYQQIQVFGGCCDCGDDQKWEQKGFCINHQPLKDKIMIDENELCQFSKEIKFLFYILFQQYSATKNPHKDIKQYFKACQQYGKNLVKFLKGFNENSIISHQLTYEALKSQYQDFYPNTEDLEIKGKVLLDLVWKLQKLQGFASQCVELFTMMFPIHQFKEDLLVSYIRAFNASQSFGLSEFNHISCQIFTCHKMINKMLNQKRIQVIEYNPVKETNFENIANNYVRFYYDIIYFSRLYNGTNIKFLNFQFKHSSICKLAGYQLKTGNQINDTIQYYGLQKIFLDNFTKILKIIKNEKQLLLHMIRDAYKQIQNTKSRSPYISFQRIFIYAIFVYFDGNIEKATQIQFLKKIGVDTGKLKQQILKILSPLLSVIKLYTLCLSNHQTLERYYTFYSFVFNRRQLILSLDFLLLKYLITILKTHANFPPQLFLSNFLHNIQNIFKTQDDFSISSQHIYDRKKALGILTSFIGLLTQVNSLDHYVITLKCEMEIAEKSEMINFYGNFLASISPIPLSEFKTILGNFVSDELPYFQDFARDNIIMKEKRIILKDIKNYSAFHLGHLKSKKVTKTISNWVSQNAKNLSFQKLPRPILQNHKDLSEYLFCDKVIEKILVIAQNYLSLFQLDEKLISADYPHFALFLQQLVCLNLKYKNQKLIDFFKKIVNVEQVRIMFNSTIQSLIFKVIEKQKQVKKQTEKEKQKQKSTKINSIKTKKMLEMKQKRQSFMKGYIDMIDPQVNLDEKKTVDNEIECMICKTITTQDSLAFMSFLQKSNLFCKKFMKRERPVFVITSCNHTIHVSCYNTIYGYRDYSNCNFCKSSSNFLACIDREEKKTEMKQESIVSCLQRLQASKAVLQANEEELKSKFLIDEEKSVDLSVIEELIESLSISILQGLTLDPSFYNKQQLRLHKCLFLSLKQKPINTEKLKQVIDKESISSNIYWTAHKFIIQNILSLCGTQNIKGQNWNKNKLNSQFSQKFSNAIIEAISMLNSDITQNNLTLSSQEPTEIFNFQELPSTLQELAKQIGKCPSCNKVTNEIAKCIICDFKSCIGCDVINLRKHTYEKHCGSSVFIRVDSGNPIYIANKKVWVFDSIYKNYLGEFFISGSKKEKYSLSSDYEQIQKHVIKHRLEQEIRYKELTKFKVCNINP